MAVSGNAFTTLSDLDSVIFETYFPAYIDAVERHTGSVINRIVRPSKTRRVGGNGIRIKMGTRRFGGARASADVLSNLPSPGELDGQELHVRFAEGSAETGANRTNDFTRIAARARISINEINKIHRKGTDAIVDVAERIVMQMTEEIDDASAIYRMLGTDGVVALVNGNLINGADTHYYTGSSYTAGSAAGQDVRFKVDNGSIAAFQPGRDFVVTTSAGANAVRFRVQSVNYADKSIRVTSLSGGDVDHFGASASAYDNGTIFFGDTADVFMYGPGAWLGRPSAGETFIGGVDRTDAGWQHLIPVATNEGQSSTTISASDFDTAALAAHFRNNSNLNMVFFSDIEMHQTIRNEIGNDALVQMGPKGNRDFVFGTKSVGYVHPQFGEVRFESDALAKPGTAWFMVAEDWEALYVGDGKVSFLPGDNGTNWYRMNEADDSASRGLFFQTESWVEGLCDVCLMPERQVTILNRTA